MIGLNSKVIGIDHVKPLIMKSKEILKDYFINLSNKIEFIVSDGLNGYLNGAVYDVINIGGSVKEVPPKILDQLKIGGRIIVPIGPPNEIQELVTIDRLLDGSYDKRKHMDVKFGPLTDLESQLRI